MRARISSSFVAIFVLLAAWAPAYAGSYTLYTAGSVETKVYALLIDTGADITQLPAKEVDAIRDKALVGPAYSKTADGRVLLANVYRIPLMYIDGCPIHDVLVSAATPNATPALGMQALQKLEPVVISERWIHLTCKSSQATSAR